MSSRSRVSAIEQEGCFREEARCEGSLLYWLTTGWFRVFFLFFFFSPYVEWGEPKMGNGNLGILDSSFNKLREY